MICRLLQGLAMINHYTKFEISMFILYQDTKDNTICRNWGDLIGQGHRQQLIDKVHTTSYLTLT